MVWRGLELLLIAGLTTGMVSAVGDPFVGQWTLNPAKSTLVDQIQVAAAGANQYTLNFTGTDSETVVANGTDQPGIFGSTLSVTVEAPDSWRVVRKKGGRTLLIALWKLSEDGKTLRDHYTEYFPDGATVTIDYVYARTSGSSGFPGTWESTSEKPKVFQLQIRPWKSEGLSFVTQHKTQNMKFDGKDYPETGPDIDPGSTSSGRRSNKQTLEIAEKVRGKVTTTRQITLSSDYKTLTMTVYPVGRSRPNIFVFDRK